MPSTSRFNGALGLLQVSGHCATQSSNKPLTCRNSIKICSCPNGVTAASGFGPGICTLFTHRGELTTNDLVLGPIPGGYVAMISTNVPGQVQLIVQSPPPPIFGSAGVYGGNLVFNGSHGTAYAAYYLLGSTNLALPVSHWTRVSTNWFDGLGRFALTNSPAPDRSQFFALQLQLP